MFNLFSKKKQTPIEKEINDEILAVVYLMVEAANIDEIFEEKEKKIIAKIISKQFHIESIDLIEKTIEKANKSLIDNSDLITHTRKIKDSWSLKKRKEVIEMLWKVCFIDDSLDPYEDMLIRKIAGLLYVEAKDINEAKKQALKSLEK